MMRISLYNHIIFAALHGLEWSPIGSPIAS